MVSVPAVECLSGLEQKRQPYDLGEEVILGRSPLFGGFAVASYPSAVLQDLLELVVGGWSSRVRCANQVFV